MGGVGWSNSWRKLPLGGVGWSMALAIWLEYWGEGGLGWGRNRFVGWIGGRRNN